MTVGSKALREWRARNGMTQAQAAEALGIPASRWMTVSRLERGEGPGPSRTLAVAIERATDGAVSVESWDEESSDVGGEAA